MSEINIPHGRKWNIKAKRFEYLVGDKEFTDESQAKSYYDHLIQKEKDRRAKAVIDTEDRTWKKKERDWKEKDRNWKEQERGWKVSDRIAKSQPEQQKFDIKVYKTYQKALSVIGDSDPQAKAFLTQKLEEYKKSVGYTASPSEENTEIIKDKKPWYSGWFSGNEQERNKESWIKNYIATERAKFENKAIEPPPEFKSNPDKWYNMQNKVRTNQWYQLQAEMAYEEKERLEDPAGLKGYIVK